MNRITIKAGSLELAAMLYDTPTAELIYHALPLRGEVQTWGDEIYFNVNLEIKPEKDAREEVEEGELGYWPMGPAFCIFFGPTPVSRGSKPKAYSPVNVFGKVLDNWRLLKDIRNGDLVTVTKK
jgi:hypothetical protein